MPKKLILGIESATFIIGNLVKAKQPENSSKNYCEY